MTSYSRHGIVPEENCTAISSNARYHVNAAYDDICRGTETNVSCSGCTSSRQSQYKMLDCTDIICARATSISQQVDKEYNNSRGNIFNCNKYYCQFRSTKCVCVCVYKIFQIKITSELSSFIAIIYIEIVIFIIINVYFRCFVNFTY